MILLLVLGILGAFIPFIYRWRKEEARRLLLTQQLHHTLVQMTHALRIGVGIQQAFEYAAQEGTPPLNEEWRRLLHRVGLGISWSDALAELPGRVPVSEMKWVVAALEITRKTGGGLTEVLESLAETLQDRLALRDKISALTAPGKASGMVLAGLPFVILGALRILVPELMRPMFMTPLGQSLIAGIVVSVAVGGFVIWRIVHLRADR